MDIETQVPTMKERLIQHLLNFRYDSQNPMYMGPKRSLKYYHITALVNSLLPFIEKERESAFIDGQWDIHSKM